MSEKKCIRFELEYDDGTISRLTGEDAAAHFKKVNSMVGFMSLRMGGIPPDEKLPVWETFKKENA